MNDLLFPHAPDLDVLVPHVLTHPESGLDVDGEYEGVFAGLTRPERQLIGILWLAHTGRLLDKDDRITFDLTDPEAAAYLNEVTCQDVVRGSVTEVREPLMDDPQLVRYNRIRECRQTGDMLHTYRVQREILNPVEQMR